MKKFKIRTAASLKKILEKKPQNEREQFQYYYLKGIYDSRIFGLCIYRLKPSCDYKNLIIYRVSGMLCANCENETKTMVTFEGGTMCFDCYNKEKHYYR